jgi:hypothetical protein
MPKNDTFELPVVAGRRMTQSNADFERACLVHIERLQNGIGSYDSAMLDTFCEAVRLVREYTYIMSSVPTKWTKEKPTEPGDWWWYRKEGTNEVFIGNVGLTGFQYYCCGVAHKISSLNGHWAKAVPPEFDGED